MTVKKGNNLSESMHEDYINNMGVNATVPLLEEKSIIEN